MLPRQLYIDCFETGSRYICNPPVLDTDHDVMFLVYDIDEAANFLEKDGWTKSGSHEYALSEYWCSYKKGTENALLTMELEYYTLFEAATELARKRNLTNKPDRVALFNLIMGVSNNENDAGFQV